MKWPPSHHHVRVSTRNIKNQWQKKWGNVISLVYIYGMYNVIQDI